MVVVSRCRKWVKEYPHEAKPLHEQYEKINAQRRRGPQLIGEIVPIVLARLGVHLVESESGEDDLT